MKVFITIGVMSLVLLNAIGICGRVDIRTTAIFALKFGYYDFDLFYFYDKVDIVVEDVVGVKVVANRAQMAATSKQITQITIPATMLVTAVGAITLSKEGEVDREVAEEVVEEVRLFSCIILLQIKSRKLLFQVAIRPVMAQVVVEMEADRLQ